MAIGTITPSQLPGSNALSIGQVTFNSSECPHSLPIGVEQMTTAQTLVGGARVVQTFGVSPEDVSWSGNFFGSFVSARVEQLRHYCASGNPVELHWIKSNYAAVASSLQGAAPTKKISQVKEVYSVIIKRFVPTFHARYTEYEITLVVVKALNGVYTGIPPQSIDTQINALQTQATSLANTLLTNSGTQATAISESMTAVNSSINEAVPISQNPGAAPSIQNAIQTAQVAITSYQSLQLKGSANISTAMQLSGVLTAISRNVALGSSTRSVTQQGGNAFTVAALQYGDPSKAYTLAQIAGLPSPFLPSGSFTTLQLPNLSS